jgi:uncharacterized protein YukE
MPIDVYIAGEASQIAALADHLSGTFKRALDDQESTIISARRSVEDVWHGEAAETALGRVDDLRSASAGLRDSADGMGRAIETFGSRLKAVQGLMDDAREVATKGGLVVSERLIEDPPAEPEGQDGEIDLLSDQFTEEYLDWQRKVNAYNEAQGIAENAIEDYASACKDLIEDLGVRLGDLQGLATDFLEEIVPGGIEMLGDDVLPHLRRRAEAAAKLAGFFASLSPEQSYLLYQNLFSQLESMDDATLIRRLSGAAEHGGVALDALMVSLNAIDRHEQGQSTSQILLSEGGGWVTGALATAGTYAGIGAVFGSPATPVGSVVVGGVALVVGGVVGIITSNQVDNWYEDAEFEDIIRNGLEEQNRAPTR